METFWKLWLLLLNFQDWNLIENMRWIHSTATKIKNGGQKSKWRQMGIIDLESIFSLFNFFCGNNSSWRQNSVAFHQNQLSAINWIFNYYYQYVLQMQFFLYFWFSRNFFRSRDILWKYTYVSATKNQSRFFKYPYGQILSHFFILDIFRFFKSS
jgi:hypothetical protein